MHIRGRFLTCANMISIARIPLSGLACLFIASGRTLAAGLCMFGAIASDSLDGMVARLTGTESDWGRILDPLADKVGIGAFLITLLVIVRIPLWFAGGIILRDILIGSFGLYLAGRLHSPPASSIWGKLSSMLISIFLVRQALWPSLQLSGELLPGVDVLGILAFCMAIISLISYASDAHGKLRKDPGNSEEYTSCI